MGYIRNVYVVPNKNKIRIGSSRGVWEHELFESSKPIANFSILDNNWYCGFPLYFIQNSTHAPGEVTYQWSFPGGTPDSSIDPEPVVEYPEIGIYEVSLTITDANNNSNTQTLTDFLTINISTNCVPTSVEEKYDWGKITVFPIPSKKIVTIELSAVEPQIEVQLINTAGQIVLQKGIKNKMNFNLNIANLPAGIYILDIKGGKEYPQVKVFKE